MYSSFLIKQTFFKVDASDIRYEFGFGFKDLYHPYVEAIKLKDVRLAEKILYDFYLAHKKWLDNLGNERQVMAVQAWRHNRDELIKISKEKGFRLGQFEEGTLDPHKHAKKKAEHLFAIMQSIEKYGYDESRFESGLKGVFVRDKVLLLAGQHRAAILNAMGEDIFRVRIAPHGRIPKEIVISDKNCNLDVVDEKLLTITDAQQVLNRIHSGLTQKEAKSMGYPFARNYS